MTNNEKKNSVSFFLLSSKVNLVDKASSPASDVYQRKGEKNYTIT